MKKYLIGLTGAAFFLPMSASAVMLTGTGTTDFALSGTTVAAEPQLAGTVLQDVTTPFSITNTNTGETLSGTIQNRVVKSSVDGTLDFYWRIIPSSGTGNINAFRLAGFDGYTLNANYRTDSNTGDIGPDTARYFGDGSGEVNFLFSNTGPGSTASGGYTTSLFFFLDTNATSYNMSAKYDLLCADTGCVSQQYSTFAPATVPVPAAIWLFGSGLMGLVGFAKRKKA